MVSEKIIAVLLILAIILSLISIVITFAIDIPKISVSNPSTDSYGNVGLVIEPSAGGGNEGK